MKQLADIAIYIYFYSMFVVSVNLPLNCCFFASLVLRRKVPIWKVAKLASCKSKKLTFMETASIGCCYIYNFFHEVWVVIFKVVEQVLPHVTLSMAMANQNDSIRCFNCGA